MPGFTRGLDFHGSLAFIGLSQIREATTFGGLPLTARLEERQCGVWVVDIDSGQTVAFLRFEDVVQEMFEVLLLPGVTFPEIAEPGDDVTTGTFVLPDAASAAGAVQSRRRGRTRTWTTPRQSEPRGCRRTTDSATGCSSSI